jgi:hypothetical protein
LLTLFSFMLGGLQALLVAFVAATYHAMSVTGMVPYRPVLLAALLAAAVGDVIVLVKTEKLTDFVFMFTVAHAVSALLCCLIFNLLMMSFRRKPNRRTVRP